MAACYHDQVHFSDPVFPDLTGEAAKAMWKMLCSRAADLAIEYRVLEEKENAVRVEWDARYTFTKTGRKVHNRVTAHLHVHKGKILSHRDHFDFWRWTRQALGPAGWLLGWSPVIRSKVRAEAARSLDHFLKKPA
jgi:ketosteroid isomerase-like protein